jgi:hypothetical protein
LGDFYNALLAGAWAPRTDLSTWPARYVETYKAEIERLEAERRAAMSTGAPPGVAEE